MSLVRPSSEALHARVRAMVHAFEHRQRMLDTFDSLAVDIARFQARHVPGYARLCEARDINPGDIRDASQAPAVPTDTFKLARVFAFDASDITMTFRTSGTTIGARGEHALRDRTTYDAAALAFGRAALGLKPRERVTVLVLGPCATEAPDSSLAHMYSVFARKLGATQEGEGTQEPAGSNWERTYFVRTGELDVEGFGARVAALPSEPPALVLATTFALVHLLDRIGARQFRLPPNSRVVHTGGFKGRSRQVPARELQGAVAHAFGISTRAVVCEYGMTELSSQFWEMSFVEDDVPSGVYFEPPWARVIPVDPETLTPVGEGAVGIARIEDLANVDSAFAVLAPDKVRRLGNGFELLGRMPGAEARGCSIALDEMLSHPSKPR
jgi:hypothetical protein